MYLVLRRRNQKPVAYNLEHGKREGFWRLVNKRCNMSKSSMSICEEWIENEWELQYGFPESSLLWKFWVSNYIAKLMKWMSKKIIQMMMLESNNCLRMNKASRQSSTNYNSSQLFIFRLIRWICIRIYTEIFWQSYTIMNFHSFINFCPSIARVVSRARRSHPIVRIHVSCVAKLVHF